MTFRMLILILLSATHAWAANERQPNIIFILADDLGWQDVGFNGSHFFETPNLDALARESLNFKRALMYPTCSPSRAALMTGKHSFRTQVYTVPVLEKGGFQDNLFSRWTVELKHKFYSQPLKDAGYKLIHLGKWHVVGPYPTKEEKYPYKRKLSQPRSGSFSWLKEHQSENVQRYYPIGKGFHENVGGTWWGDPARGHKKGYQTPGGGYVAPYKNPFLKEAENGTWLSEHLTNEAMDFIKRNKKQPFFINLHYYAPHRPSIAKSPQLLKKYQSKARDSFTGQSSTVTKEIAAYATMVETLDSNVGRLIAFLEKENLRDNTVIIFTSDNGFNMMQSSTTNLRGHKGAVYEGGLRVPAIINWPGKITPGAETTPISVLDYFPTFLDIAGVKEEYTETLDGNSLLPLARRQQFPPRTLFWHIASAYKQPACSIARQGNWKLIQFLKKGNTELYDLDKDPTEKENLNKTFPEKHRELLQKLTNWRRINKVPLPPSSILKN